MAQAAAGRCTSRRRAPVAAPAPRPAAAARAVMRAGRAVAQPAVDAAAGPPPGTGAAQRRRTRPARQRADRQGRALAAERRDHGAAGAAPADAKPAVTRLVPWQPWAKALYDDRQKHELEPHTRCKASGVSRQFLTPYGVEIVELPELQRIYIFDVGGPHTYRTIYMDGRTHPKGELPPTTTAIRSAGGKATRWSSTRPATTRTSGSIVAACPHTEQLHTLERFTRVGRQHDPLRGDRSTTRAPTPSRGRAASTCAGRTGTELFEYVCQQANYAHELMVGDRGEGRPQHGDHPVACSVRLLRCPRRSSRPLSRTFEPHRSVGRVASPRTRRRIA